MGVLKYRNKDGDIKKLGGGEGGSVAMEDLSSVTTVTPDATNFTGTASNVHCYELGGMRFFQCALLLYAKTTQVMSNKIVKLATLAITGRTIVNSTIYAFGEIEDVNGIQPAIIRILPSGSIYSVTKEPLSVSTNKALSVSITASWAVI